MIFKQEFKWNLRSLIIWSIIIGGLTFLMMQIYPDFAKQQEGMKALLEAYPEGIKKAFGMDKVSMGTVLGFYAIEGYMLITLIGSIYVVLLAGNMLAKEESEKTIEFLLSKPITRTSMITQKLLVVVLNVVLFNLIVSLINLSAFLIVDDGSFEFNQYLLISIAPVLLHLTFAAIAFLLSSVLKKGRQILSVTVGLVFITYFLQIISSVTDSLENLKFVSPFSYVDAADIILDESLDGLYIFIMVAVMLISTVLTFMYYRKKDIAV
ncbi:ABC transporter permease subunit [Alkalihalobacillus sp. AL-G]|uniref:ABC transporter permease subunit n=1 Tax=Alkalihalobacillus sp. AL-G TaxID=2926399 RepID=UPI00272BF39E|nr:ABC transporter permease subunit [Alkalihalobacillus sp. AL-G]WLD91569.1 ABC transporter permease [Alkalihalobacillus sp. AL-G]